MPNRLATRLGLAGHPRGLWVLFAATLVNRCGTMVLPFLALYLTGARGFRPQDAGAVLAVYGAGALVAAPLGGRLADRFGPRAVMVGSLLASGVVLAVFPLAHGIAAIASVTLALSLTIELFRPASQAAIGDLASAERRRASFAFIRLAINLGMSIGPAIGGLLVDRAPRLLFAADAATSVAAAFVLLAWGRNDGRHAAVDTAGTRATTPSRAAHRSPRFLVLTLATFLFGCVFFQGDAALPIFLVRDLHLPAAFFGVTYIVNTALIVAFELPLNTATSAWPHARTLALGGLFCASGFAAFALVHGEVGALLAVAVWTVGEMMLFPAIPAFVADVAPPERIGEYMGLYSGALGLAFSVGPYLGLRALDAFGSNRLWAGAGGCGILAAALFYAVAFNTRHALAPGKSSPD